MSRYVARRLLHASLILWGVLTAVFLLLHVLPGDPVSVMLAESGAQPEAVQRLRKQLGLDLPLHEQYGQFLLNAVRGDLGTSIFQNRPVLTIIQEQLPATIELTGASMVVAICLGVTMGATAAMRRDTWIDRALMLLAGIGVAMPSYWLALLGILVFSLALGWFPATGQGGFERLVLPAVVLGLGAAAAIARLVRSSLLEVLHQDYVRTAWAKGLSERTVVARHALRNALIPVVTVIGLQFGWLLSGTVIAETIFSRQGIGRLAVDAILAKDVPVVMGAVLVSAIACLFVNLLVDLSYAWLDPRISYGQDGHG